MTPDIRPLVAGNWKMNGTRASLDQIKAMAEGETITVCKVAPAGALQARSGKKGIVFFWRYSQGTTSQRLPIGPYDSTPGHVNKHTPTAAGYSIAAAIKAAEALAVQHVTAKAEGSGMGEILEQQKQAKAEAKAKKAAAAVRPVDITPELREELAQKIADDAAKSAEKAADKRAKNQEIDPVIVIGRVPTNGTVDLNLPKTVQMALDYNRDIKNSKYSLRKAEYAIDEARAGRAHDG